MFLMSRIGGGSVRHRLGRSLYLGRLGPRPARGQLRVPRSADVALNLDMGNSFLWTWPCLRSRSARERAALPLSYVSRSRRLDSNQYPPLKGEITPTCALGPAKSRDSSPRSRLRLEAGLEPARSVSETDPIPKYQLDSHREGMFSCANNVSTTVGPARLERALAV